MHQKRKQNEREGGEARKLYPILDYLTYREAFIFSASAVALASAASTCLSGRPD